RDGCPGIAAVYGGGYWSGGERRPGGLRRWVVYRTRLLAYLESCRGVTLQPLGTPQVPDRRHPLQFSRHRSPWAVSRRVSHILVGGGFMRARLLCLLTAISGLAVLPGRATGQQPVTVTGRVMCAEGMPLVIGDIGRAA